MISRPRSGEEDDDEDVPSRGELASWLDLLRELVATQRGLEDFALLRRCIHRTADFLPTQLRQLVRQLGPKAEEVAMRAAERLMAEGRAEGRAEGEVRGKIDVLLRLLTLRFGELSGEARTRIAEAKPEQLAVDAETMTKLPIRRCSILQMADLMALAVMLSMRSRR
jgi:hypothetical protein